MSKISLSWCNDDCDEISYSFPSKNGICPECEGYGTHLNPSMRNHAYSSEEFNESFDDFEKEEYFKRGGMYDVVCTLCKGNKVIQVVDESSLDKEENEMYAEYKKYQEELAFDEQNDRLTRFYECGGM